MRIDHYKVGKDRAQYFVSPEYFEPEFSQSQAWSNDGRPLRYLGLKDEPGGQFHAYEGVVEDARRVKRIEQNPALVKDMFDDTIDTLISASMQIAYRADVVGMTKTGSALRKYDKATEKTPYALGAAAKLLREITALEAKASIPEKLPMLVMGELPIDGKAPEAKQPEDPDPKATGGYGLLLAIGAALIGVIVVANSEPSQSDYDDED